MASKQYQYINLDYLELMSDGDQDMKMVMIDMLLTELPTEMGKMTELVEDGNMAELKAVSHKFKSTLAFVGNDLFTQANKEVERIAKEGEGKEKLPALIETMSPLCENVVAELQVELSKL